MSFASGVFARMHIKLPRHHRAETADARVAQICNTIYL